MAENQNQNQNFDQDEMLRLSYDEGLLKDR